MKKIVCIILSTAVLLITINPSFAFPADFASETISTVNDAYSFDAEIDGAHITGAIIVENGIARQLTQREYQNIMNESEREVSYDLPIIDLTKIASNSARGFSYEFNPTSRSTFWDAGLKRRVSPIYQGASSISVTNTTSFTRTVTQNVGISINANILKELDATVKAEYSYVSAATSSTSTTVTGNFSPSGKYTYAAVVFTPRIAEIKGVLTETLSAMGSSGSSTHDITVRYPVSTNGIWDGIYRIYESNNLSVFPDIT